MIIDGILILVAAIIYSKYRDLRAEVSRLKQSHLLLSEKFRQQHITLQTLLSSEPASSTAKGRDASSDDAEFPELTQDINALAQAPSAPAEPRPEAVQQNNKAANTSAHISPANIRPQAHPSTDTAKASAFSLDTFIAKNGLFWLGGVVLALGGVFLARYAIDAGLLPPTVRLSLGALFGVGLVVGAEFLSRHAQRFNIHTPVLSASIASGGFIILAAVVLKVFLVDSAGLEGLYRALSYIILGLSLVAIGWLFQRLSAKVVSQV